MNSILYLFALFISSFINGSRCIVFNTALLKNINPTSHAIEAFPANWIQWNNLALFPANDGENGTELWRSDGTESGTFMLRDINPGSNSSDPKDFEATSSLVYFAATSSNYGRELWRTDGTISGTFMIKDVFVGSESGYVDEGMPLPNGEYLFIANSSVEGVEAWKTDGTTAGTTLLRDLNPNNESDISIYFIGWFDDSTALLYSNGFWLVNSVFLTPYPFFLNCSSRYYTSWKLNVMYDNKIFTKLCLGGPYDSEPSYCTKTSCTQIANIRPDGTSGTNYIGAFGDAIYFTASNASLSGFTAVMRSPWTTFKAISRPKILDYQITSWNGNLPHDVDFNAVYGNKMWRIANDTYTELIPSLPTTESEGYQILSSRIGIYIYTGNYLTFFNGDPNNTVLISDSIGSRDNLLDNWAVLFNLNEVLVYLGGNASLADTYGREIRIVSICGDRKVTKPEACDDGNNIDGDGCSANCLVYDGPMTTGDLIEGSGDPDTNLGLIIGIVIAALFLISAIVGIIIWKRYRNSRENSEKTEMETEMAVKPQPPQTSELPKSSERNWDIPSDEIKLGKQLGSGNFATVYQGRWRNINVAVKQLTKESVSLIEGFEKEMKVMMTLRPHTNVVVFYGISKNPLSIVMQFCEGGTLFSYLRQNQINSNFLVEVIQGVSSGMLHLHSEELVHCDLAARNVLIDKSVAKISDFGLSRILKPNDIASKTIVGPLKWMAPESLSEKKFSPKSDAWAFAVLIWEILHPGKEPYPTLNSLVAASKVLEKEIKLEIPDESKSPILHAVMESCMKWNPDERPSFKELCTQLETLSSSELRVEESTTTLAVDRSSINVVVGTGNYLEPSQVTVGNANYLEVGVTPSYAQFQNDDLGVQERVLYN